MTRLTKYPLSLLAALPFAIVANAPGICFAEFTFNVRTVAAGGFHDASIRDGLQELSGPPLVDAHGHIIYQARSGLRQSGVWLDEGTGPHSIVRTGDTAIGTGALFDTFSDLVSSGDGKIAFKASLIGSSVDDSNRQSIWGGDAGALTLLARTGARAPHPSDDLHFSAFETPLALNDKGQVLFFARTISKEGGTTQGSGIWLATSTGLQHVASAGLPALSGLPSSFFLPQGFEQPFANDPVLNSAGKTIFRSFLAGPGIDETNSNGLWSFESGEALQPLERAGDEFASPVQGRFVSFPAAPTLNSAGDTAFLAFYQPATSAVSPGVTNIATGEHEGAALHLGLWIRPAVGELQPVFVVGGDAPGVAGAEFVDTFDPVMNEGARVAFVAVVGGAKIDSTNEMGVWSNGMSAGGTPELIARQGSPAPGTERDTTFGTFLKPAMNALGQTVFMASAFQFENGAVASSGFGIWGQDRSGRLRLVAREGDLLEVAPGDVREIEQLLFASAAGGGDGRATGVNDFGQVAFGAIFTDRTSGVFVSTALTIPELGASTLLWTALVLVFFNRCRELARHLSVSR